MKRTNKCPKCESTDIIVDATVVDRYYYFDESELEVATHRKPEALIFKDRRKSKLSAWVCASCGFVELYADTAWDIKVDKPKQP